MRRSVWLMVTGLASIGFVVGCGGTATNKTPGKTESASADVAKTPPWFRDVSAERKVSFVHQGGRFGAYEMPTIMGSGCALADFDRDGRLDLYYVNGRSADGSPGSSQDEPPTPRGDGFFRQRPDGNFEDISRSAGVSVSEFGMGAWWGDFDGDGFADLFLTNVGRNRLFRNLGDGTFDEVPLPAGVVENAWSTAATWCDIDADGDLDLLVINYVDYVPGRHCEGPDGRSDFCGPSAYPGTVDRILINTGRIGDDGSGLFVDETVRRGLGNQRGKGLGAVAGDLNGDGRVDFYVANDMEANRLWIQQSDGTFKDQADLLGVSRNFLGQVEASMGIVTGDFNGDGHVDLFLTHLAGETNTLYLSDGNGFWNDATAKSRLGPASLKKTGFGIGAFDVEHNGTVDFLVCNGAVMRPSASSSATPLEPYVQSNAMFLRSGASVTFQYSPNEAGPFAAARDISRALAVGDLDRDGDCDAVVANCMGAARVYLNESPKQGNWLALKLVDTIGHRDANGARVRVTVGNTRIERIVDPYQGYLSQNDAWLNFGLGKHARFDAIEIRWPDGTVDRLDGGPTDRRLLLLRGGNRVLDLTRTVDRAPESQRQPGGER